MLRVLCDTNVLVSALIAAGPPSRIIDEVIAGHLRLVPAEPVLLELERVLRDKLRFDEQRWLEVRNLMTDLADEVVSAPEAAVEAVTGDCDDDLILACAIHARADVLVSGDHRHLLPVGERAGVPIVTPQALLADLRA